MYDLIVIGSGPGGTRAAIQAAKLHKKVLLVERQQIGGASVHKGTIPSKSLREAALVSPKLNFADAMKRTKSVLLAEAKLIKKYFADNCIDVVYGTAAFLDSNTIEVGEKKKKVRFAGKFFVVATGTSPIRHEEFPWPHVLDSDSVLQLKKLPKSMLVIGAGVIGCEYASIFTRLGTQVTLIDRRHELLRSVDDEIIARLRQEFKTNGVNVSLGVDLGKMIAHKKQIQVVLNRKKKTFEQVLVCMGRAANTKNIGLEKIGVKLTDRGNIVVDNHYQTNLPNVYAVGDVIGPPALAAASAEQGRIAACRIFGESCEAFPQSFPYGIYTIPEISSVGMLDRELIEKKIPFVVGKAEYSEVARGLIMQERGLIKLLVHKETKKILGIHAIGAGATELIHIGQAVFALEGTADFLVTNVFNYPTFAEAYKVAALNAINQIKNSKR